MIRRLVCALRGHDPDPERWATVLDGERPHVLRPCRRCPAYVYVPPLL